MIRRLGKSLRRFKHAEEGSMVIPFALWLPLFIMIIVSGMELGTLTMRHTAMERALDQTVREVRLGTGTGYTHDSLKQEICRKAAILPDCMSNLKLEMVTLNIRNWRNPSSDIDCVDTALQVNPATTFEYGLDNDLMLLRACFKYKPISPAGGLGSSLNKDTHGFTAIVSTSAFVQEPS